MTTSRSSGVTAGLALFALLSLFDVVTSFIPTPENEPGPPVGVLIAGGLLGVVSLVLIALMWRGSRGAVGWLLIALRLISALLALPAFFVPEVPTVWVVLAAVFLVLTVVSCVLVLPALRGARADAT